MTAESKVLSKPGLVITIKGGVFIKKKLRGGKCSLFQSGRRAI
jgi:hypothetical protein